MDDQHADAPADPPRPPGRQLDLLSNAARAGQCAWLERRLFEVLGGWVPSVSEPAAKNLLAVQSYHHAWHADLWQAHVPPFPDRRPGELVAPPSPAVARWMDDLSDESETVARLVGLYRVVGPRLVAGYAEHLDRLGEVADGPVRRTLRLALRDEVEDWQDGTAVLLALLVDGAAVDRAAAHQARLERALVAAGGLVGAAPA